MKSAKIGDFCIDSLSPVFVVAEIGINHNGDFELAKDLIFAAAKAGANGVKFQKRNPDICVPEDQKNIQRETPWGTMSYLEYRYRMEFDSNQYRLLEAYANELGLLFFASPWDVDSLKFLLELNHKVIKIASACLTDQTLLSAIRESGVTAILSTGMSRMDQIAKAVSFLNDNDLVICHSTSTYPCPPEELNLRVIQSLQHKFSVPIGYSGHEVGLSSSVAAVALGAKLIERHITLDRSMWGSDQSASVEPVGFRKLVEYIRTVEKALGDGEKRVYPSELPQLEKLRRFKD